ncbi:MAG: sigma-70 family RNA polymerase sigma factor [Actinobacteria bacterium]|nr:sigma-70 family RNA polymerase sigma factor [Actinomycetota bacterium]
MRAYLNEIGAYPLLTKDDEIELARRIEAGREAAEALAAPGAKHTAEQRRALQRAVRAGDEAHERFVTANLRLVVSIAKAYQSSGMPLLDLIQEGNLGLMHAVDKFDWRKGFKFSTYATWWIRQAIQRGVVAGSRLVRLPAPVRDAALRLQRVRMDLEARNGREPTVEELAAEAFVPVDQVIALRRHLGEPFSLDEPIGDGDAVRGDLVADPTADAPGDAAIEAMVPAELDRLLAVLDDREQLVLRQRYGFEGPPVTQADIGAQLGLSADRVRQIERQALAKLRRPEFAEFARALLDAA